MINVKRILVPTDFSDGARHALRYGFSFAREYEAELLLLHVVESVAAPYASDLFPVPMAEVFQELSAYARGELDKLGEEAKAKGLKARTLSICHRRGWSCGSSGQRFRWVLPQRHGIRMRSRLIATVRLFDRLPSPSIVAARARMAA